MKFPNPRRARCRDPTILAHAVEIHQTQLIYCVELAFSQPAREAEILMHEPPDELAGEAGRLVNIHLVGILFNGLRSRRHHAASAKRIARAMIPPPSTRARGPSPS